MPESLLAILKLCAIALLYLFFLRVLRAVWSEISPKPAAAPATGRAVRPARPPRRPANRRSPSSEKQLVVLEPKPQAGLAYLLSDEVTVGRASGCTITLEDGYVSQLHARLFREGDAFQVEDLGSTNGTYLNGKRVTSPTAVSRGDQVRIGATVLEVRT